MIMKAGTKEMMVKDAHALFALRSWGTDEVADMLRSILASIDEGILVTDLEHTTLACNGRFGEIFGIEIERVVRSDAAAVRQMVIDRIFDSSAWYESLETTYLDPRTTLDDLLVLKNPKEVLSRKSRPIFDSSGTPFARLWTFEVVTDQLKSQARQLILQQTSLHFDDNPRRVYEWIVDAIGYFYGSLTLLSIRRNDILEFHAIGGPREGIEGITTNRVPDSYCQFCINLARPIIIQNALAEAEYASLLPAK